MVAESNPHGLSECFVPRDSAKMCCLWGQLKYRTASVDDPAIPVPSLEECQYASDHCCKRRGGVLKSFSKCPLYLLFTDLSQTVWGVHLRDLTSAGM